MKFVIHDIQKVKRTASQEKELKPACVLGDLDKAISNTEDLELVFVLLPGLSGNQRPQRIRTRFLDQMREKLIMRMGETDEGEE